MTAQLHRVVTLLGWVFWRHVTGWEGLDHRDLLIMGSLLASSALLWTVISFRARAALLILGGGVLLSLIDWGLLELLPRLEISYGRVPSGLWLMLLGRGLTLVAANGLALLILGLWRLFGGRPAWHWGAWMVLGGQLVASALFLDMWLVEPLRVSVSQVELSSEKLPPDMPPIRMVQISDIHMVTYGPRERKVVALANQLRPDLILLTGDYLNELSERSYAALRQMAEDLEAPHGIYAVTGNVDLAVRLIVSLALDPAGVRLLDNERVEVDLHGGRLELVGLSAHDGALRGLRTLERLRGQPAGRYRILLFHYPDFVELASQAGVDLYLAGHTHGGQVRLPLLGALYVNSLVRRDYEMGRYDVGGTTLFVSRGVGFSGGYEPQARFHCPPEVVLITLQGRR